MNKQTKLETDSPERTLELGAYLARLLQPGLVIALNGPLGAGKTHFVKGLAEGLGVQPQIRVTSPTFVLINEYPAKASKIYHIDAYRLNSSLELSDLGFEEFVESGVVVIEWASKVNDLLPPSTLYIEIEPTGEHAREFRFEHDGVDPLNILKHLEEFE